MMKLQTFGSGQGYLKAGFFGWQGSGKTYTAMLLAVGLRRVFNSEGPLVMFDSEGGAEYIAPLVKKATGVDLLGVRTQALTDLRAIGEEALKLGAAAYLVDSITHPWKEVMEAHLAQVNAARKRDNLPPRTRLEIGDWAQIKPTWNRTWTDFFLNAPLHILICGRAGNIWMQEVNEETGRRELLQEGVKMKVEGEFAYEPSLLCYLEQQQIQEPKGRRRRVIQHQLTVLKDRFGALQGMQALFKAQEFDAQLKETFGFFAPHVALLTPGAHAPIDTSLKTDTGADADGDTAWSRERRLRAILAEEIQGELVAAIPGQSADEKRRKTDLVWQVFHTRSWTQVESLHSEELRTGLAQIRTLLTPADLTAGLTESMAAAAHGKASGPEQAAPEQAERTALITTITAVESALQLKPADLKRVRLAGGITELGQASLDTLTLYRETLQASAAKMQPGAAGGGDQRRREWAD